MRKTHAQVVIVNNGSERKPHKYTFFNLPFLGPPEVETEYLDRYVAQVSISSTFYEHV